MSNIPGEVVVAGHICLDLIPAIFGSMTIEPGRLTAIGPALITTGGAVGNTGLALHKLGVPVRLMGKVGDDFFGRELLALLRAHGRSLADDMIVAAGETTSYSIVISQPNHDRSFWHCTGANDTFSAEDVPYDALAGAKLFHFGYPPIMARMFAGGGAELGRLLARVREGGLATSLDMAQPDPQSDAGHVDWAALLRTVLPHVDVFLPSVDELQFMLNPAAFARQAEVDGSALRELGARLLALGVPVVCIKLGQRGLYVRITDHGDRLKVFCARMGLEPLDWSGREIYAPCFRAQAVVGTTGAGDCTVAGFIASLLRGEGPARAATSACAVGASSVEAADAIGGVRPWPEIDRRIQAGWERLPDEFMYGPDVTAIADAVGTLQLHPRKT